MTAEPILNKDEQALIEYLSGPGMHHVREWELEFACKDIIEFWEACARYDKRLQGPTWDRWKVVLKAIFGLTMNGVEQTLFRRHTGRTLIPDKLFRTVLLAVGRRGGKSNTIGNIAAYLAVHREYQFAAGERGVVLVMAQSKDQARVIKRYIGGLFNKIPFLKPLVVNETATRIELTNNVDIEIAHGSYKSVRGYSVVAAIGDEFAFWNEGEEFNREGEFLRAIRPAMANTGGILFLISSPYARKGEFWEEYNRSWGRDDATTLVWNADTATMNPSIPPEYITEEFKRDPSSAKAEYGVDGFVEFRDDVGAFVTPEAVDAVTRVRGIEQLPVKGVRYYGFVDPAGGSGQDSFTIAIGHNQDGIAVVDVVREVVPPFSPMNVVQEFSELCHKYGVKRVVGDKFAGAWPLENFALYDVTYEPAAKRKSDLYMDALALINAARVELPPLAKLRSQLVNLERRVARGGKDSIDHPKGAHDDVANAACGLLVELTLNAKPARTLTWGKGRKERGKGGGGRAIGKRGLARRRALWERVNGGG